MELDDQEVPPATPEQELDFSAFLQETAHGQLLTVCIRSCNPERKPSERIRAVPAQKTGEEVDLFLQMWPPPLRQGILGLYEEVGAALSSYGWFIIFSCILLYLLKQKFSSNLSALLTPTQTSTEDPGEVVRRQEAVAAARLRMQEELNAQAERYKEKQRQLEEEKRRQKIESWESMKEGKSCKVASRLTQPQEPSASTSASSSAPKPKPDRRPLRSSGYNPLTGDGGGTCAWRPGRRGPSAGG